jgi:hypothetical protein
MDLQMEKKDITILWIIEKVNEEIL